MSARHERGSRWGIDIRHEAFGTRLEGTSLRKTCDYNDVVIK